ncbi:methionyl-tRNA formyltransferase [Selenomonas ruminantium]|uniref:methionyl-tRNA formyltransferase n=1 Tax=Selenomonas ruminantium TaxID=971 RepID=UPI0026E9377C|nr:methionyl-tRNA formyltransferase [Selenomonas ruminantium]
MMIVIVSNKDWHRRYVSEIEARTSAEVVYLSDKKKLTKEYLQKLQPKWVFFPHWSYIIPADIYENFRCVIFHMTDLPFGRGGSPLQNLIARGIYETKLSAIRCVKELDGGEIYKKVPLSLWGTAEEIYLRAAELTKEIMIDLVLNPVEPKAQAGEVVAFQRRKPADGDISVCENLEQVFDYIRMLDAESYPAAFLETDKWRLEFSRASLRDGEILADVRISNRKEGK